MRVLEVTAPRELHTTEKALPSPAAGEVRIRVAWAGVCGTDYSLIAGKLTFARYPIVPGHEFSGFISAVGAGVDLREGQRVTINPVLSCRKCPACLRGEINHCEQTAVLGVAGTPGGFADEVIVPADTVRLLPPTLALDAAALIEPVAVAVQVVRESAVKPGDKVAVLGSGNIGLLVLQVARIYGAEVVAVSDLVTRRLQAAQRLGAEILKPDAEEGRYDVVIDGIGLPETVASAARLARRGGRIGVYGVPSQPTAMLPFLDAFRKDLRIAFIRLYPASFDEAITLLDENRIDLAPVVSHRVSLEQLPETILAVMSDPSSGIKILTHVNDSAV